MGYFAGGSSLETRRAAAEQIAAIVAAHPAQLPAVIAQVLRHLRHKDWDARVAAGHCLGRIADHVAHHTPFSLSQAAGMVPEPSSARQIAIQSDPEGGTGPLLSFDTFSIATVVEQGTPLLASAGEEYDAPRPGSSRTDTLSEQRNSLKKRLGLGGAAEQFINTADFLADEDFLMPDMDQEGGAKVKEESETDQKKGATELLADMTGMSARERAAAVLKAKAAKRRGPVGNETSGPAPKRAKNDASIEEEDPGTSPEALEAQWQAVLSGNWPFQQLCDQLCVDLLSPLWEVRHGAALALREILSSQANSAAVSAPLADPPGGWTAAGGAGKTRLGPVSDTDIAAAISSNAAWLEDCAIHMLCTLALDRFGDYLSDQVVAPVRETAAQALGTVARVVQRPVLLRLLGALRTLADCSEWEARHGGLQGLKYVLAAQDDVDAELLAVALPASIVGLRDKDDDVRAVAAEALLPAASLLAHDESQTASHAISLIWDALLATDELSPAVKGATSLLAVVYSAAGPSAACVRPNGASVTLASLIPRLWPHLRHNLSSVRLSTVRCFSALVQAQPTATILPGQDLSRALRLVFQNILLESDAAVLECSQRAWTTLVSRTPQPELAAALNGTSIQALFSLACTQPQNKFDTKLLVAAGHGFSVPQAVPGGDIEGQAERTTRMRVAAAGALGELAHVLGLSRDNPSVQCITTALRITSASARVLAGFVVARWAQLSGKELAEAPNSGLHIVVQEALTSLTTPVPTFDEHASSYAQLRRQAAALIEVASRHGAAVTLPCSPEVITPDAAAAAVGHIAASTAFPDAIKLAAQAVHGTATILQTKEAVLRTTVASALSAAVVHAGQLPPKLNSLIQPLIASVRREPEALYQDQAALTLAKLAVSCASRIPSPTERVVKNVCGFACGDRAAVPSADQPPVLGEEEMQKQQSGKGAAKGKANNGAAAVDTAEDPLMQAATLTRRVSYKPIVLL